MELEQITFDFDDPVSEKKGDKKKPAAEKRSTGKNLSAPTKIKSPRGRKNLKDIIADDSISIPEDDILFRKSYYSIGDVASMFNENASLIRYWENEFDILKPKKNAKGDRFFRPEDVKNLKLIHHLLRQRKYTIEGAKEFLKKNKTASEKFEMIRSLQKLKSFLNELKENL
jgi:DNA-binding transcriptional MerR regulator